MLAVRRFISRKSVIISHSRALSTSQNENAALKLSVNSKVDDTLSVPLSLSTASEKEILKTKIQGAIKRMQMHECDSGSTPVQIAVLTEKIKRLAVHFTTNKKDYSSMRGYWALIHRRRSLMKYLKNENFESYRVTVRALELEREDRKISQNFR